VRTPNTIYHVVVFEAEEGGFWAEVLELPGCVAQGENLDELRRNAMDAIDVFLEAMDEEGEEPIRDRHFGTLELSASSV
jgi:predicted RNase H-like HicB family nuclease